MPDTGSHPRSAAAVTTIPSNGACSGQPAASVTEEKKASTQVSPRLYDLTTLQREANNRFGLSARRTLQIAQALYERHKLVTYPRTDSRALPEDYLPTVNASLGERSLASSSMFISGAIILAFVIVAVFIAGLMVGRTPEYLGKKIEAYEMKMAAIGILIGPAVVLLGTAVAVAAAAGRAG